MEGGQSRILSDTRGLLAAWLSRDSCCGYKPGPMSALDPGYSSTAFEAWRIEEMGWAFLGMHRRKQLVLRAYIMIQNLYEWRCWKRENRMRQRQIERVVLELQEAAARRGVYDYGEEA